MIARASERKKKQQDEAEQQASLRNTGRFGPRERELVRKDGSRVSVRVSGFLVDWEGQDYVWSVVEDITHRGTPGAT